MKTLIILHGGDSWKTQESYVDFLKNGYRIEAYEPLDPVFGGGWKNALCDKAYALGWNVYFPSFPCKQNAKYSEWKIILDRILALVPMESEITFVGHSLGGNFIIKYLAETDTSDRKISAVHLVAACYDVGSFSEPADAGWKRLSKCADAVYIWQAKDDTIVPVELSEHIRSKLPGSEYRLFETGGHFKIPEFQELEGEVIA